MKSWRYFDTNKNAKNSYLYHSNLNKLVVIFSCSQLSKITMSTIELKWRKKETKTLHMHCSVGCVCRKPLSVGHIFFSIFDHSRRKNGKDFSCTFATRQYNRNNHCPCARPAHVAESRPRAWLQVFQTSGSWMFMLRVQNSNPVSARSPLTKFNNKKKNWERSNIKAARVCADGLSATQNGREAAESFSTAPCWNWTHLARLTATQHHH